MSFADFVRNRPITFQTLQNSLIGVIPVKFFCGIQQKEKTQNHR
jgi:hypothetical protein